MGSALSVDSASSVSDPADWVRVKSLVVPRPQPKDPNYATTTETFLNKGSVDSAGKFRRATFRQSVKDSTGYEMSVTKNRRFFYYYDCTAGRISWAKTNDATPDPANFMPYADYSKENPNQPFADSSVVSLVCKIK
jgi:hypothetical protein